MSFSTFIRKFFTKLYSQVRLTISLLPALCSLLPILSFAQMEWTCATPSAGWTVREFHSAVAFDNKIWLLGGHSDTNFYNDVWYSTNGVNWINPTTSAPWSKRFGHSAVNFDKICLLGGYDTSDNYQNDLWYSVEGIYWIQGIDSAPWLPRMGHTSVVFDNSIWVLGGCGYYNHYFVRFRDVWYSTNGMDWISAAPTAEWTARNGHSSVVFDNKLWVIGGYDESSKNDVWYSTDGLNWTCATDSAEWQPRYGHTSVVFENKIWVIGGFDHTNLYDDVWYSSDGVNWIRATDSAGWTARTGHSSVVFDNKIWLLGGSDANGQRNDVWYSRGLGIQEGSMLDASRSMPKIYPNPFKTSTEITYHRSKVTTARISIYNIVGKEVKLIFNGKQNAGSYKVHWNGQDNSGRILPAGIYFIRLESGRHKEIRKIIRLQ